MSYKRRQIELLLNDESFIAPAKTNQQFRIVFSILIDFGSSVSYCDCRIYNLSEETEAKAFTRGVPFGIRAGYDDTIDYIFRGEIRNVFKEREGPNTITRLLCRGGSQPPASVNQTFGENTKITDIIKACVTAMGYSIVISDDDFNDVDPYLRGYSLYGDPRVYLDNLAKTHRFNYVIENERVIVTRSNSFRQGEPFTISEATGMEGIPEITEVGCDVSVRLQPKIRIGGRIDIQSELRTFNFSNIYYQDIPQKAGAGIYRVFKLEHTGDTWGDAWTTKITGFR